MKREEFEHTVRAAGAILGVDKVLVIGSQAIHGSTDKMFPEAQRSIEVDISALNDKDGSKADLIDASIGELSMFQESYGYYAQGVTPKTAILPSGWRKRLVAYTTPAMNGVTALCLESNDLWIAKAIAHRPKDIDFCKALVSLGLVKTTVLKQRLKTVKGLNEKKREQVLGFINRL